MSHPAAATIVARNYLPAASVLAASYRRHHAGAEFAVLVVDAERSEVDGLTQQVPGARILTPADLELDPDEFGRMAMCYSVTELCTAVKPWLLRRLLQDHPVVIYLDPDIEVFAPFGDEVGEIAAEHSIALTPHVLEPIPRDGLRPSEADIMASGVFNLGFIGVSRDAEPFLKFWAERLRQDAISSITEQLFTDQRWVDNVPAMFPHHVIADPGYNVAYWNVYQRPLGENHDGTLTADGVPLRFLHYSGYRPEKPWLTSVHFADRPRVLLSEHPQLAKLFASYRTKLLDAGYPAALEDVPYRWGTLPDGTTVSAPLRRAFRELWIQAERDAEPPPPNPFAPGETLSWATTPANAAQKRAGLNPWALAVWQSRLDVQAAFPDPLGANADAFRTWCATSGVAEAELPTGAVSDLEEPRTVTITDEPGVNVLGYLTTESGVGELGRLVHEAIRASGLPVAISVEESTVVSRKGHALADHGALSAPVFGVSVVCVNADMTSVTLRLHPELARDRYVIGVWSWELSDFPPSMHGAFDLVDEVWANSEFAAQAIAAHSPVPVYTFPIPVLDPLSESAARRTDGAVTRFLFMFDHESLFDRKNPTAVISAFQRAFPARDDVRLLIKSINGDRNPGDRERLRAAAAGDDRIELVEGYLDADEVSQLYAAADCYVSLHRSEGFGLTVAEAMVRGLPVIATQYSATRELLSAETGWPIPYREVQVGAGSPPYPPDAFWAEPDIDAAVAAMREVADSPEFARQRGAAAREHMLATRSMDAAATWVRERLIAAHHRWRGDSEPAAAPTGPVMAVRDARTALATRPDVNSPARMPMARTLRRTVLRALNHHDEHQQAVLGALMDGIENSVGQLTGLLAQKDVRHAEHEDLVDQQLATTRATVASLRAMLAVTQREHNELASSTAQRIDDLDRKVIDLLRERDERLDDLARQLADVRSSEQAQRLDDLDRKIIALIGERDERMDRDEIRLQDLERGLRRLHDVLSPPPEEPTEAVATDVGLLRLPADDTVVLPWLREYGTWEADESRLIDVLLPPGGVFVDVGAHVGYFTVRALRKVGSDGLVVAVEPWATGRELLERNIGANVPPSALSSLVVVAAAAWDSDGPLRFAISDNGNTGDNRISPQGDLEVRGLRLDGVPALGQRQVDVVKTDTQGNDHRALAGMTGLFDGHLPQVLCEFDPAAITQAGDDPATVLSTYRSWGYEPVPVTSDVVRAVAAGGPSADLGALPSDNDILERARAAPDGFLSLWLRA